MPAPGIAVHDAKIPEDLVARCAGWRMSWGSPRVRCCWLRTPRCSPHCPGNARSRPATLPGRAARPLPLGLTTDAESWRELLLDTHRAEAQLLSHADFP